MPGTGLRPAPVIQGKNLLVNGGFEIWQRGNGPFTANGVYTADRWITGIPAGSTINIIKNTTNQDQGSVACAAVTFTYGATGNYLVQTLEDFTQLTGQTLSLSMRVKTSTANTVRIAVQDSTGFSYSAYHPGDGAYHTLTTTRVIQSSATFVHATVNFEASCTFYLDNAMLVIGPYPVPYQPLTPAEEWERCQRYYEVNGNVTARGYSGDTNGLYWPILFNVAKAITPTVTLSGGALGGAATGIAAFGATMEGFNLQMLTNGAGIAQVFSASGAAEANP